MGNVELADVVEQRGPVQEVELACAQPELAPDALRVCTYPLGVSARERVVLVEVGDEL